MSRGTRIAAVAVLATLVVTSTAAVGAQPPPTAAAAGGDAELADLDAGTGLPPELGRTPTRVTLVSGDVVTVHRVAGEVVADVEPAPGREQVTFSVEARGGRLEVVPSDAVALLGAGRLDRRLFDVAGLVAAGYHDAARPDVPLLVVPEVRSDCRSETTTVDEMGPYDTPAEALAAFLVTEPSLMQWYYQEIALPDGSYGYVSHPLDISRAGDPDVDPTRPPTTDDVDAVVHVVPRADGWSVGSLRSCV